MRIISPSLFFFFSFHLGTIAMAMVYEGTCKITKVIDANMNDIEIPAGNFLIKTQKHFHEHIVDDEVYDVSIKIGNSMGTSLKILGPVPTEPDDDKIEIGPIRSTMMMPPEKVRASEAASFLELFVVGV
jgi:hypothetical protein